MKRTRNIALLLALLVLIIIPFHASAQYSNVQVLFNGEEIDYGDNGAYYDADYKSVMAPLKATAEALGADAEFNTETGKIKILKGAGIAEMTVGDVDATMNINRQMLLTAPPVIDQNGTLYAPLDFIADALMYDYEFKADSMSASVDTKFSYTIGAQLSDVKLQFGDQDRIDIAENGCDRYVFVNDYNSYTLADADEGTVFSYFIAGAHWSLECGIFGGMKLSSCESLMVLLGYTSKNDNFRQIYEMDNVRYTVYFDAEETIYAVRYENINSGNYGCDFDDKMTSSLAIELTDLVNCYRALRGYSPLPSDGVLASVAKSQSNNMANGNYFSHNDSSDQDYTQRMEDAGYSECYVSEIIAEAYNSSISLFSDLAGDLSYMEIITADYEKIGCGVSYNENSDGLVYYTQLFYAAKD